MKKKPIPRLRIFNQPPEPSDDPLFGGTLVNHRPDLLHRKTKVLEKNIPYVGHVIDAPVEIRPWDPVLVDINPANKYCLFYS